MVLTRDGVTQPEVWERWYGNALEDFGEGGLPLDVYIHQSNEELEEKSDVPKFMEDVTPSQHGCSWGSILKCQHRLMEFAYESTVEKFGAKNLNTRDPVKRDTLRHPHTLADLHTPTHPPALGEREGLTQGEALMNVSYILVSGDTVPVVRFQKIFEALEANPRSRFRIGVEVFANGCPKSNQWFVASHQHMTDLMARGATWANDDLWKIDDPLFVVGNNKLAASDEFNLLCYLIQLYGGPQYVEINDGAFVNKPATTHSTHSTHTMTPVATKDGLVVDVEDVDLVSPPLYLLHAGVPHPLARSTADNTAKFGKKLTRWQLDDPFFDSALMHPQADGPTTLCWENCERKFGTCETRLRPCAFVDFKKRSFKKVRDEGFWFFRKFTQQCKIEPTDPWL